MFFNQAQGRSRIAAVGGRLRLRNASHEPVRAGFDFFQSA
jgi:hypothetical protein